LKLANKRSFPNQLMQLILQRPKERSQPNRIATRRKKKNQRVG